ncbi:hypothetical protein JB92DRAFT_3101005 [Gautieria morchelliformis]|nr:hypothetical protein JB92DRAFT_3101005 [Gautieria morchelliformis]
MNNLQLPGLSELWLHYNGDLAAAADRGRLTLPPLRLPRPATPRPATPPLPIPATLPGRRDHRRGAPKAKGTAKSGKAQGRAARGGSSPRTTQQFTSMDAELNLSPEAGRTPLVTRDHGKQRRGRGGAAGCRVRGKRLVLHQYEFVRQPDGSLVRSEWIS